MALVGDNLVREAHQRHHAPQKDVDFLVIGKALQHAGADETVIGMVEHDICAQRVHDVVEAFGGEALEEGVGVPAAAHAVHHLGTVQILAHHLVHGVDVILTIAVDGDGDVAGAAVQGFHQTGQHSVLVAAVAALGDADKMLILFSKLLDEVPRFVPGTIVHEQHPAFFAHKTLCGKAVDLIQKHGGSDGQHLLLVVTGDHDP